MIQHGVLVSLLDRQQWRGVLILGPSGAGKSDLAFRLMEMGFQLTADDQVVLWTSGGRLYGRAPDSLFGLMEAHGLGIVSTSVRPYTRVDLIVEADLKGDIERMPQEETRDLLGVAIPLVRQRAKDGSAAAKIRRWLMALG